MRWGREMRRLEEIHTHRNSTRWRERDRQGERTCNWWGTHWDRRSYREWDSYCAWSYSGGRGRKWKGGGCQNTKREKKTEKCWQREKEQTQEVKKFWPKLHEFTWHSGPKNAERGEALCLLLLQMQWKLPWGSEGKIFEYSWEMGDAERQKDFIVNHVVKREKINRETISRRIYTFEYYLTSERRQIWVCNDFFLKTLDVSEKFARSAGCHTYNTLTVGSEWTF